MQLIIRLSVVIILVVLFICQVTSFPLLAAETITARPFQAEWKAWAPSTTKSSRASQSSVDTHITLHASNDDNDKEVSSRYEYKDDCFGFISFLGGLAMTDVIFTSVFVGLSLMAAVATRQGWLPSDPKRTTIVDRKIPGLVAALTLVLSSQLSQLLESSTSSLPSPDPIAQKVQLAICVFSIVTALLDIRWRDRFDYPEEFRN